MNKSFHVGLHIDGTLAQRDSTLEGLLCSDGETLSAAQVRDFLTQLKTEFPERELFTTCDNQNEKGYCQGHPAEESIDHSNVHGLTDTDLIEWLDRNADYWGELESGTIRFTVDGPTAGFKHLRDIINLAIAQQKAAEGSL